MKIRAEPQGSYFNANLRRRNRRKRTYHEQYNSNIRTRLKIHQDVWPLAV